MHLSTRNSSSQTDPPFSNLKTDRLPSQRQYRILMIAPTSFFADYGCHVRIREEIQILQELGHEIVLTTYYNGNSVPGIDIRRTLPIPWRRQYEVGSSRHKIAFDLLLGIRTAQLLVQDRFDIIHGHLHEGALLGLILGRMFSKPVVFDFQGSLTEEMVDHGFLSREHLFFNPLRRLERWIDRSSAAILPSSAHAAELLVDQFDCDRSLIHVLPDCVNTSIFKPRGNFDQDKLSRLRRRLGIPHNGKLIVYLGLLTEYQGISHLLQAVKRILTQRSDVYLLLMGFPLAVYAQKVVEMGLQDRVIMTGKVAYEEAPLYLALGDVAAAPKLSLTEGSGKLLNYMAAGLPTVAFDTPVAREYLGRFGVFADRGDVDSLAYHILALLGPQNGHVNSSLETGASLRDRAVEHYDWQTAGRQIERIYAQVSGELPGQPAHRRDTSVKNMRRLSSNQSPGS